MNVQFEIWKTNRIHYNDILENCSTEQLNVIPEGFNNNMIWNIGHAISIQQVLIYKRSGLDMIIPEELYLLYKSGSKPDRFITDSEIKELRILLNSTMETTLSDFENGIFQSYSALVTSTQFKLDTFEIALNFNNYHEGLHLGYINSLKKFTLM